MILIPALLLAQTVFTYSDAKGDLFLRANDGQGEILAIGWKFELRGSVAITSKKKRFTLNAPAVTATVGKSKGGTSPDELKNAKASGGVRLSQTAQGRSSNLQSKTATYTSQGEKASVQAIGSVRLQNVDERKRETMVATGSSGTAILNPNSKRGIDQASLNGPVRVEIVQSGNDRSKIVFTGNKLILNGDTATLTGNVKASGAGASQFGNLSNVDSVTVKLNEKGEMSSFRFRSGGSL